MRNKCKCGCGALVKRTWKWGHHSKIKHPMQGKSHSLETREKMSDAAKGRIPTFWKRAKHTKKSREKMSKTSLKRHTTRGENHPNATLTEEQATDIKYIYQEHLKQRKNEGYKRARRGFAIDLADFYGVDKRVIIAIGNGFNWKHI